MVIILPKAVRGVILPYPYVDIHQHHHTHCNNKTQKKQSNKRVSELVSWSDFIQFENQSNG